MLLRFASDRRLAQNAHLHLIHYRPHGCRAHACAVIWEERARVHLASPLLREREGVLDPQPLARQFSDSLPCLDQFEDVMGWLDAACYAASRCEQVARACAEHPEWDLRCEPFDGADDAVLALRGLMRAASEHTPPPPALVRECVRLALHRLLRSERKLGGAQFEPLHDEDDDLGIVETAYGLRLLVSVRHHVRPTQAMALGVLARYRMTAAARGESPADRCLLILPDLDLQQPIWMTPRAAVANLYPVVMRDALVRLAGS